MSDSQAHARTPTEENYELLRLALVNIAANSTASPAHCALMEQAADAIASLSSQLDTQKAENHAEADARIEAQVEAENLRHTEGYAWYERAVKAEAEIQRLSALLETNQEEIKHWLSRFDRLPYPDQRVEIESIRAGKMEMSALNSHRRVKELEAEVSRLAALLQQQAWQSIETAPKDGKPFLVYWPKSLSGGPEIDRLGGWTEYSQILDYGEPPATHWMPLPDPPPATSSTSTEEKGKR